MAAIVPGLYADITAEAYFADPCPTPSLTQSTCKLLLERSPLHAWVNHPRLNPDYRPRDESKFDIANIAHRMLIGRGREIVVLPEEFTDWRRKDARLLRDAEAARGKLAVLSKHFMAAETMVKVARDALGNFSDPFFGSGHGECMIAWQVAGTLGELRGVWCRQLLDWLSSDRSIYCDYKTTEASASPHAIARRMVEHGWCVQAAFAELGLNILFGVAKRRFVFVTQEVQPPYALSVAELSEACMTMGRKQVRMALRVWEQCLLDNLWPAYPARIVWPDYPGWAEAAWLERESVQDDRDLAAVPATDYFMAG
jgi:hypothetical protein